MQLKILMILLNCFALSGNCLNDTQSQASYCSCQTNFDCEPNSLFNNKSSI